MVTNVFDAAVNAQVEDFHSHRGLAAVTARWYSPVVTKATLGCDAA